MARGIRRFIATACSLITVVVVLTIYSSPQLQNSSSYIHGWIHVAADSASGLSDHLPKSQQPILPDDQNEGKSPTPDIAESHLEIFSQSRSDGKYYPIDFGDYEAINPNMIPHPQFKDTWILVAQQQRSNISETVWFAELTCNAVFTSDRIVCTKSPLILPIAPTTGDKCVGELEHFQWSIGPHDARVSFDPLGPYAIFGSQSSNTCFGQWMQDLRTLVDWGRVDNPSETSPFWAPLDLQRPPPYSPVEKNWFPFWNLDGKMYLHYDISPARVFAELLPDGSVGPDLAAPIQSTDSACLAKYLPSLPPDNESIHQSTNSLSITLCNRSDPTCTPNTENTFIMATVQHKRFYNLHSTYEPYVLLFRQTKPFTLHAISEKPIWVHGRGVAGEKKPRKLSAQEGEVPEWKETEMFYITSINWMREGQRYHGYLDDTVLLGFGIEDEGAGVLDVRAGELLGGMGSCA